MDYYIAKNREECEMFIKDIQATRLSGGGESCWSGSVTRYVVSGTNRLHLFLAA